MTFTRALESLRFRHGFAATCEWRITAIGDLGWRLVGYVDGVPVGAGQGKTIEEAVELFSDLRTSVG